LNAAIVLGILGLLIGGFRGLVIGAALGFAARWLFLNFLRNKLQAGQAQFLESNFAIMGALSKADGVVTRDEIQAAQRIFDMLRLSEVQREQAKEAFNRGKSPDFDLDAEVDRLRGIIGFGRGPLLRLFLQLQCAAIAADGQIHSAEHAMLVRIAQRLGLTERDVAQLEALLRAAASGGIGAGGFGAAGGPGWGGQAGSGQSGWRAASGASRLADAYTALGVTPDASDAEIKRAYRRLVSENHPDKLQARGLPDAMLKVAEERTREINVAYDLVKESRGFK
jgi:DnaJ like chaperone protein